MNLKPLQGDCSKADEIDYLKKIADLFTAGTYLHDLFTERFFGWVEGQLRQDFPPDMMEHFDYLADTSRNFETAARRLNDELDRERSQNTRHSELLSKELDTAIQDLTAKEKTITYYRDRLEETERQSDERGEEIERLEAEIMKLKVKLYDLQAA